MNNDFALIAQLHKCVGETQTSLTNTLKKQIQEFIKTAQTAKHHKHHKQPNHIILKSGKKDTQTCFITKNTKKKSQT